MARKRSKQQQRRPSPVIGSDGEEQFVVEKIIGKRKIEGVLEYHIRWDGYSSEDDTWEEADKLKESIKEMIDDYEEHLAAKKGKSRTKSESVESKSTIDDSSEKATSDGKKSKKARAEIDDEPLNTASSSAEKKSDYLAHFEEAMDFVVNATKNVPMESTNPIASSSSATDLPPVPHTVLGERAVRPQINREESAPVKVETSDLLLNISENSSGRSSVVDGPVPAGCKLLKTMVNDKEVEVIFCDIRKHLNFTSKKMSNTKVYVMDEKEKSLDNLQEDDIEWPYAVMKRLSTGELRILVKIKGTDRRALVDYNSRMLFNKFPEVCKQYLNVLNHFRRCWTEVERNIKEYETKLNDFMILWKEIGKSSDSEIHKKLPEPYKSEPDSTKAIEGYLTQMNEDNKVLFFFILAKVFGDKQTQSSEGSVSITDDIKEAYEKRSDQFKSISIQLVYNWMNKWKNYFSLP